MKRTVYFFALLFFIPAAFSPIFAQTRGGRFSSQIDEAVSNLDYHAFVIGINNYGANIPDLETSLNDSRALVDVLRHKYGFKNQNIIRLYDKAATRSAILRTLRELSISLNKNDALLIYYAGHGIEDPATNCGYWIPADARPNAYETYISNADIRTYLRAIKARHIFLVSDSCFSGTLLSQRAMPGDIDERFYAKKAKRRSRVVLTSGGNEPVMDAGRSGHSIFGYFFIKALKEYDRPYLIPTQIFMEVGPLVANNAPQTPQWGALREAMDEGGEIVFVNRQYRTSAFISFTSNRTGAVYLNESFIGNTPIESYKVPAGDYAYKVVSNESGVESTGNLTAHAGDAIPVNVVFDPPKPTGPGFLSVSTKPWVRIYLDGENMGYSPKAEIKLSPGLHSIRLVNSDLGVDRSMNFKIEPGQHLKIGPNVDSIKE